MKEMLYTCIINLVCLPIWELTVTNGREEESNGLSEYCNLFTIVEQPNESYVVQKSHGHC